MKLLLNYCKINLMAEKKGFEPSLAMLLSVFETDPLNLLGTSPINIINQYLKK